MNKRIALVTLSVFALTLLACAQDDPSTPNVSGDACRSGAACGAQPAIADATASDNAARLTCSPR